MRLFGYDITIVRHDDRNNPNRLLAEIIAERDQAGKVFERLHQLYWVGRDHGKYNVEIKGVRAKIVEKAHRDIKRIYGISVKPKKEK